MSLRPPQEPRGKPCHPVGMASLYLMSVGTTNFIRAGSGRDFEHAPPIIDFGLLRCLPILMTLSLSLAVLLGLPPPFLSLSLLFDRSSLGTGPVLLRLILSPLGFLLLLFSLAPKSGLVFSPAADVSTHPPYRHKPDKDDHSWEAVKAVIAHSQQHDARPDAQCVRFHFQPGFTPSPTRAERSRLPSPLFLCNKSGTDLAGDPSLPSVWVAQE